MKPEHKTSALNRLKTVRGHIDAVIRMVEDERYCPDIMKQVSALQGSLEGVCVLDHVKEGRSEQVVDELLETLRYAPGLPTQKG
jgi:DNA-binding FrmR family transcriptional regulator